MITVKLESNTIKIQGHFLFFMNEYLIEYLKNNNKNLYTNKTYSYIWES